MPSSLECMKSARIVEIFNPNGTITTCPSIYNAAKLLGGKSCMSVYGFVAKGGGRIVDIRVPVEVMSGNGTRSTYRSINEAAETLRITTMEVYTMVTNGKASFGVPIREVLTILIRGRRGLRTRRVVEVPSEDGTIRVFESISGVGRTFGINRKCVYTMVALIYRLEEGKEEEEEGEEEEGEGEEAVDYHELYKEKEEVKDLKFELLLTTVREMAHTGVLSEVLENSRETDV